MTLKHKSDGFRYGDTNPSHVLAIRRVIDFWNKYRSEFIDTWIIDESWVEQYSEKFVKENPDRNRVFNGHTPDIVWFEWIVDRPMLKLIIEVDGESHDSKTRKISDKIFEKWIFQHHYGTVPVIRLQKRELVGDLDLAKEYLRDKLGEYLK